MYNDIVEGLDLDLTPEEHEQLFPASEEITEEKLLEAYEKEADALANVY